jgi:hypothetical protein
MHGEVTELTANPRRASPTPVATMATPLASEAGAVRHHHQRRGHRL